MAKAKTAGKKKTSKPASRPRKKSVPDFPKVDLPALVSTALHQVEERRGGAASGGSRRAGSSAAKVREPTSASGKTPRPRPAVQTEGDATARAARALLASALFDAPAPMVASARSLRLSPRGLVLTIAIAASCGALAALFGTFGLARLFPSHATLIASGRAELTQKIAPIDTEFTPLNRSPETSTRTPQSVEVNEAADNVPPPKTDDDTTGSIPDPQTGTRDARTVEGWVLRNVYGGAALVEGRPGLIQVMPGDSLPGVGRIESITRQDGRWVVVTSKGLIATR
jgi:hypothetical protein